MTKHTFTIEVIENSPTHDGFFEARCEGQEPVFARSEGNVLRFMLTKLAEQAHTIVKPRVIPANLQLAMEEKSKRVPESLSKLIDDMIGRADRYDPWAGYNFGKGPKKEKTADDELNQQLNYALDSLVSCSARAACGYSHASDKYDDMTEAQVRSQYGDGKESSDDDESSDEFSKYDYQSDIKDDFGRELVNALKAGLALQNMEAFPVVMKFAVQLGYTGSAEELAKAMSFSPSFQEFARRESTKYTG